MHHIHHYHKPGGRLGGALRLVVSGKISADAVLECSCYRPIVDDGVDSRWATQPMAVAVVGKAVTRLLEAESNHGRIKLHRQTTYTHKSKIMHVIDI